MQSINGEIIVVDNASPDNSMALLGPLFPDVHFVQSETNIGFGRACNLGLTKAKGNYVLFLNPDTLVAENTLNYCVQFLTTNQQCGAVGVKMINGFGRFLPESKRARPSLSNTFFKITGLAALFPQSGLFNHYALGKLSSNTTHPISVLAGAFMMVRKDLLETLQGFDPIFFMYGEDIDLSLRILQSGYTIYYLGEVSIIHYKGQSSKNRSQQQNTFFYKAMRLFVNKHYKAGWLINPFILLIQVLAGIKKLLLPPTDMLSHLNTSSSAFIIGSKNACEQVSRVLDEKNHNSIVKGSVFLHENNDYSIKHLSDLPAACRQHHIKQVIARIPDYSLEEIMPVMEASKGVFFRFVFEGSAALPFNK